MKDNGGQAFPSESMYTSEAGMTLRDYFAAKSSVGFSRCFGVSRGSPSFIAEVTSSVTWP